MSKQNGNGQQPQPASLVKAQVIPTWQPALLAELEQTGNLAAACRAANVEVSVVSQWRRRNVELDRRVVELLRARKLSRDENDQLVEVSGPIDWDALWHQDESLTIEQAFLMVLGRTLNASEACRLAGVAYSAYKSRFDRDPDFARLVSLAKNRACDELEGALFARALMESDGAAVAMLRAHRPDVYRTDNTKGGDENRGVTLEEAMRRGFERRRELPS